MVTLKESDIVFQTLNLTPGLNSLNQIRSHLSGNHISILSFTCKHTQKLNLSFTPLAFNWKRLV